MISCRLTLRLGKENIFQLNGVSDDRMFEITNEVAVLDGPTRAPAGL